MRPDAYTSEKVLYSLGSMRLAQLTRKQQTQTCLLEPLYFFVSRDGELELIAG